MIDKQHARGPHDFFGWPIRGGRSHAVQIIEDRPCLGGLVDDHHRPDGLRIGAAPQVLHVDVFLLEAISHEPRGLIRSSLSCPP
jgi:hypothetical protein